MSFFVSRITLANARSRSTGLIKFVWNSCCIKTLNLDATFYKLLYKSVFFSVVNDSILFVKILIRGKY